MLWNHILKEGKDYNEGGKCDKEKWMVRGHAKAELLRQLRKGPVG